MSDQQRGRGRARGRARGGEGAQGGPPPARGSQGGARGGRSGPAQPLRGPIPIPPPSAWGPRSQMSAARAPAPQTVPPPTGGRATYRGATSAAATGDAPGSSEAQFVGKADNGSSENGNGQAIRRGTVRGRRQLHEGVIRTRPESLQTKQGTFGTAVRLSSNYFKLIQQPNWCIYQYRVDFSPEEDRTFIKKKFFRTAMLTKVAGYIFDGSVLYLSHRLEQDITEVFVQDEVQERSIRITIRLVGDLTTGDYHYLQLFNIIMRKCLGHLKLQLVGRNFFDAIAKIRVQEHRMELWPGYVTSIRQHESSILLCVEITHKIMKTDTVHDLLNECAQQDRSNVKKLFSSRIIGSIVITDYNNKTYHIDDVDFNSSPTSTFPKRDGTQISFIEYYKSKYNISIRNLQQPLLVSRAKAREIRAGASETIILIPELCRMTGLTDAQRSNFNLMRALAEHTRVGPSARIEKLLAFSKRLREKAEIVDELRQWDLQLANALVEFPGRILPPETITGGGNSTYSAGRDVDWTRELRARPMLHSVQINVWVVVCTSQQKDNAQSFVQILQKAAKGMQWQLPFPKLQEIRGDKPSDYMDAIDAAIEKHRPEMILCIVPNNKADRYAAIKKKCIVDKAVLSQVIVQKNLTSKGVMSIATKVAIQMNCKVGGAPWSIPLPYKNMMVVGYDVCHDSSHKERSYGALVSTLNVEGIRYFSTVSAHTSGEELSNDFALNIIKATRSWQRIHNVLPEKIAIYRDGVGDGQLEYVFQHEVQTIRKQLIELYGGEHKFKLIFIVVSKRINTRIFHNDQNPAPGTVVDDVITLPERYDFFIVSQCVRQGTVAPTSYNVLYDNMGQSADKIQRITYKLTHMYFNWSGTVRVPAPCQYAHKLAFFVAQSLHRGPHPELENLLYFL